MSEEEIYENERKEGAGRRLVRLEELETLFPMPAEGFAVGGGLETGLAFIESRTAYIEGLWLCTVLTATTAIERHIAADLYAAGDNSVIGIAMSPLLEKAAEAGRISAFEQAKYQELANIRDGYARFRKPIKMVELLVEAGEHGLGINEVLQDDARMALTLASAYFLRNCAL